MGMEIIAVIGSLGIDFKKDLQCHQAVKFFFI